MAQAITQDVIAYDKASKVYSNVGKNVTTLARQTNQANNTIHRSARKAEDANTHFARASGRAYISTAGHLRALAVVSSGVFAAAAAGAFVMGKSFVKAANDQAKANAQTAAVIKSTGGAAHVTAKQVGDLAGSLSNLTGIQDDTIQATENMLLTFKNIRNQTGKNNDIFNQATKVVTDMSVALGQDGVKSSIQLGKALNDPVTGITALMRVGVTFTDAQKKQIKTLVEHGKILSAQKIILKELSSEFGGSAAAQATAGAKMAAAWDQVKEKVGGLLNLALIPLADWFIKTGLPAISSAIDTASKWIKQHWTQIQDVFTAVSGAVRKAIAGLGVAIGFLVTNFIQPAVAWIIAHWPQIKSVFVTVAQAIGTAVIASWKAILWFRDHVVAPTVAWIIAHWPQISAAFQRVWREIQPTLQSLGQLAQAVWKQIIQPLVAWVVAHWPQIAQVIKAATVFAGVNLRIMGVYLLALNKTIQIVAKVVTWLVNNVIGPQFRVMLHVVSGTAAVIIRIWNGMVAVGRTIGNGVAWAWRNVIAPTLSGIAARVRWVRDVIAGVIHAIQGLWRGIGAGLAGAAAAIRAILGGIARSIQAVQDALDALANRGTVKPIGTQTGFRSTAVSPYKPRAAGGPVTAGVTYQVGERGPEWFTPNRSGTIIPNGAGGNVYITVQNVNGVQSTSQLWQELQKYAKRNGSIKLSGITA